MAGNSAIVSNVHNYYLANYAPKEISRFDTHKKSELRNIYNSIVKLNKESPLYKLDTSKASHHFAIGIKDNARILHNLVASLGGLDEEQILNKKVASSSNEDIVSVSYIGDLSANTVDSSYDIEVISLASEQVNIGTFLPNTKVKLPADTYSFDVNIKDLNYEFQFTIKESETNLDLHDRLAKLITNADIGIRSDVIEDGKGNTALRLRSISEGLRNDNSSIFIVSDDHTSKKSGSVSYFGLDYLARPASNARFMINGTPRTSNSNRFTIDNLYEINLKGISSEDGEIATVGLKTDVESLNENINNLIKGYNSFVNNIAKYTDDFAGSQRLLGEMRGISNKYQSSFDIIGLNIEEDSTISIDKNELKHAALTDYAKEDFSTIKDFANSLIRKSNQITLNPMNYVDKTIVTYKNPGKNFATPYITSAYSGMLFNSYC